MNCIHFAILNVGNFIANLVNKCTIILRKKCYMTNFRYQYCTESIKLITPRKFNSSKIQQKTNFSESPENSINEFIIINNAHLSMKRLTSHKQ